MNMVKSAGKTVLILGANSDVAKAAIKLYVGKSYKVVAASRNLDELKAFALKELDPESQIEILYFDAADFSSHQKFYDGLSTKPHIVVYAAGFLKNNEIALKDWEGSFQ